MASDSENNSFNRDYCRSMCCLPGDYCHGFAVRGDSGGVNPDLQYIIFLEVRYLIVTCDLQM